VVVQVGADPGQIGQHVDAELTQCGRAEPEEQSIWVSDDPALSTTSRPAKAV